MNLSDQLLEKKETILKKWFKAVSETYQPDTRKFLGRVKDPFANPVGSSFTEAMEAILDGLIGEQGGDYYRPHLDRIVKIRSLQKFTPSQSLFFILELKKILRTALAKETEQAEVSRWLGEVEEAIDALLFLGFDLFVEARERLADIRVEDEKRRLHMLLRRAKLLGEDDAGEELALPDFRQRRSVETNTEER